MSDTITSKREIPKAKYYVVMVDRFMSGWGCNDHKDNRVIVPCADYNEAKRIAYYCKHVRTDMIRVRVCCNKPRINPWQITSLMTRENGCNWYDWKPCDCCNESRKFENFRI